MTDQPMKRSLGVCYYPEHWPETQWTEDAARMAALGLTWVRIGEFAWSRMEPVPGKLELDWLDRAISTLADELLKYFSLKENTALTSTVVSKKLYTLDKGAS